jgi:cytoskeletal protein RodZ
VSEDLRERLRAAAADYEPDGDRIWARVERGMSEEEPQARRWWRMPQWNLPYLAMATATAVVLVAAVVTLGHRVIAPQPERDVPAANGGPTSGETTSEPDPTPSEQPTEGGSAGPSAEESQGLSATPPPDGATSSPPETPDVPEHVDAEGVVDPNSGEYWGQSNLNLRTDAELTALTITIFIATSGEVESAGAWSTVANEFDFETAVVDGYVVYRWTLKDGAALPEGDHVFAAQYNHGEGERDFSDDRYEIVADDGVLTGGFTA